MKSVPEEFVHCCPLLMEKHHGASNHCELLIQSHLLSYCSRAIDIREWVSRVLGLGFGARQNTSCVPVPSYYSGDEDLRTMALAAIGKLEEFYPEADDFIQYNERLEVYMQANDVKADKKQAVLLTINGARAYKTLRRLAAPQKPVDLTYDAIVDQLEKHYSPMPTETAQRYRFKSRTRKDGESAAAYLAVLRALAEHCNFGTTLDTMVRDMLVWGINNDFIQQRLLTEGTLTLKRATEIELSMEAAEKYAKEMKATVEAPTDQAHKVRVEYQRKPSKASDQQAAKTTPCHRCGRKGHQS